MISIDDRKKKQLRFYSRVAQIAIVCWLAGHFVSICQAYVRGYTPKLMMMIGPYLSIVSLALIVFCGGQFIQYVLHDRDRPGIFLRHGGKILYFSAAIIVFRCAELLIRYAVRYPDSSKYMFSGHETVAGCLYWAMFFLSIATRVALLVVLARVFRRVMPMIEESKTLV